MARDRRYNKVRKLPQKGDTVRRPFSEHIGVVSGYNHASNGISVLVDWGDNQVLFEPMSSLVPVTLIAMAATGGET